MTGLKNVTLTREFFFLDKKRLIQQIRDLSQCVHAALCGGNTWMDVLKQDEK